MKKLLLSVLMLSSFGAFSQTKKVLLEDFTGRWCQYCPNGTKGIEDLLVQYPTNFIGVSSHNANGDPLEVSETPTIIAGLGGASYPNGAIDRKFVSGTKVPIGINSTASQWKTEVASRISSTAIVSVAFDSMAMQADSTYTANVVVKFTSAPSKSVPITLQVMVLEDSIAAEGTLSQANGPTGDPSPSPATTHYGSNSPLTTSKNSYWHNHNVRKYLGGAWGFTDVIPSSGPVVNTEYSKSISITIPKTGYQPNGGWDKKHVKLVAFVAYNGSNALQDEKMVLNAEEVHLSAFHPVGIEKVAKNVEIVSAYPNPVNANDIVNISYNIAKSEIVTMNVYNMVGQVVAQPYVSNEVRGNHTIKWVPAQDNVTPGVYMIEVSSASGKQVQRITVQ